MVAWCLSKACSTRHRECNDWWASGGCSGVLHSHVGVVLEQGLQHVAQGRERLVGIRCWLVAAPTQPARSGVSSSFGCTAAGAELWAQLRTMSVCPQHQCWQVIASLRHGLQLEAQCTACR